MQFPLPFPFPISVANEEVRCNNGSEIFHWNILRNDNPMRRNPYEFLALLQRINQNVANDICQWHITRQSRKQQFVERAHKEMVADLEPEIKQFGYDIACNNFFQRTKYLTKMSAKFFERLQLSSPNSEKLSATDINFADLWIQDREKNQKNVLKRPTTAKQKIMMTLSSIPKPKEYPDFDTKRVIVTNVDPITVRQANRKFPEMSTNLCFNHATINELHAELLVSDDNLFMQELGSIHGTRINDRKIGRVGVRWCPQQLTDNDTIQFGAVKMKLAFKKVEKVQSETLPNPQPLATKMIKIVLETRADNQSIPLRLITLIEGQVVYLGRAKVTEPATTTNAKFNATGMSWNHAKMWLHKNKVFILPQSRTYPTVLNKRRIHDSTYVPNGCEVVFGFDNKFKTKFQIFFDDDLPTNKEIPTLPTITFVRTRGVGMGFPMKQIKFVTKKHKISIGRASKNEPQTDRNSLFDCSSISKFHATLSYKNGQIFVIDLNSANGTYINSKDMPIRVRPNVPTPVPNASIIQFGSSTNDENFVRAYCRIEMKP